MEDLYLKIAERLGQNIDGLSLIDEDYGQLTETEDGYPVTFPCALINAMTVDWDTTREGSQRGEAVVTVKLAFDCYEDTHLSAGTTTELHRRNELDRRVVSALHCYKFGDDYSPMMRTQSRQYTLYPMVKVYEQTFRVKVAAALLPVE